MKNPTVMLGTDSDAVLVAPVSSTLTLRLPLTLEALDGLILDAEATRHAIIEFQASAL
jgi:hypothetical protein